jgi:hypothetical protein
MFHEQETTDATNTMDVNWGGLHILTKLFIAKEVMFTKPVLIN